MKTWQITGLFAILILGFLLISGCTQDNNKYCSDNSPGSSYNLSSKMCEKISTETPVTPTPTAVRTKLAFLQIIPHYLQQICDKINHIGRSQITRQSILTELFILLLISVQRFKIQIMIK